MALAQLELKQGSTYTRAGKTYVRGQRVTSTDAREIAWAKACGFMQVLDLEAAAREAERARAALEAAAKAAGVPTPKIGGGGKGKKGKATSKPEPEAPTEEELFPPEDDLDDGDADGGE